MEAQTKGHLTRLSIFHYIFTSLEAVASLVPALYILAGLAVMAAAFNGAGGKFFPGTLVLFFVAHLSGH